MCSSSLGIFFYADIMEYYKNLSLKDLFYINDDGLVCCEEWRDIHGYENLYMISDLGRIKRLSYKRYLEINKSFSLYKTKILKQCFDKNKYLIVSLSKSNIKKTALIHQLVAKSFLLHGQIYQRELVVDHIKNNRTDNRKTSLQIITHRKNSSKDRHGISIYTGVSFRKDSNKWSSAIGIGNKGQIKLGSFINESDAGKAYIIALENISKYNGNNKEFRELIKSLI